MSYAGAALIAAGVVLMVLEAFAPSFGALGIGGLAAFALGATMLFDTDVPEFQLSWQVIAVTTIATGGFLLFVVMFALGAQTRRVVTGVEYLVRQIATVESWDGDHGWVLVEGERWRAVSDRPLQPGQKVRILDVDHLTLKVKPA